MSNSTAVPVLVLSERHDESDAISRTLRNAGIAAHCHWHADAGQLRSVLEDLDPQLLFIVSAAAETVEVVTRRDELLPDLPILLVGAAADDTAIGDALACGAQDLISLSNPVRFQAVAMRELNHCLQSRRLAKSEASAEAIQTQLNSLVLEAPEPMLYVSEGIIAHANPSWLEEFGYAATDDIVGTPVMDAFGDRSHSALKGALSACASEGWNGQRIKLRAINSDASRVHVAADFETTEYDDEACVRVTVHPVQQRSAAKAREIVASNDFHPLTGFFNRQRYLAALRRRLSDTSRGGQRVLVYVRPDDIVEVRETVGPIVSDELLLQFAQLLEAQAREHDLYGQFGGDLFMVLLERGTLRDAVAWAENFRRSVEEFVFDAGENSVAMTVSIGIAAYEPQTETLDELIRKSQLCYLKARDLGGNRVQSLQPEVIEPGHRTGDTVYVQHIKASLMQNNFRLAFQPVACLTEQNLQLFDVLLRLSDVNGREMLPAEFLPAAQRNGLMKNIDRWVTNASIKFCEQRDPDMLFIRLSTDSLGDETLAAWIRATLRECGVKPSRLVFQMPETVAEGRLREVRGLAAQLCEVGCRFALEHFGVGVHPLKLLGHIPLQFVKIDGSLMEGLVGDEALQSKVRRLVEGAKDAGIRTIAERVEDANTMAVLWQTGVEYVQGYYVQAPEEIVMQTDAVPRLSTA